MAMKSTGFTYFNQIFCSIIGKGAFLTVTVLLFKSLTFAEMAHFAVIYAISTILATISECGMRGLLAREMSRLHDEPEQANRLLSGTVHTRLWTLLPFYIIGYLAGFFLVPSQYWLVLFMLMGAVWLDSNSQIMRGTLRAFSYISLDAILSAVSRIILLLITVVLFLIGKLTLDNFSLMWLMVSIGDLLLSACIIAWKTKLQFSFCSTKEYTYNLLKRALPFTVLAIIGTLYIRTGILILGASGTQRALEETAGFNLAGRIPEGVSFLPIAVMNATIPYLSRSAGKRELLAPVFRGLEGLVGGAGIIIAIGLIFFTKPLILFLSVPEYLQFSYVFQVYAITVIFSFLQYIYSNLLLCIDQEHRVAARYGAMLIVNVILNLVLVWELGAMGAAIALLICEFTAVIIDLKFLRQTQIPLSAQVLRQWGIVALICISLALGSNMLDGLMGLGCYLVAGGAVGLVLLILTEKRRHALQA